MKLRSLSLGLGALALSVASIGFVACSSSDDSTPGPTPRTDSGTPNDSGNPNTDAGTRDSSLDANANCDPNATIATDPLNVCADGTGACIKFDSSRVPANAP